MSAGGQGGKENDMKETDQKSSDTERSAMSLPLSASWGWMLLEQK